MKTTPHLFPKVNLFLRMKPDTRKDITAFSRLHSWYKHLDDDGQTMYPFLTHGKEPQMYGGEELIDEENEHWWFCAYMDESNFDEEEKTFLMKYPVTFTCRFSDLWCESGKMQVNKAIETCERQWKDRTRGGPEIPESMKRTN